MKEIRVRFAPSPTGPLHIGGVRTALYNYLFAKKHGGKFILRIEDTDQTRFVPGAEEYIIESLTWCGITFDEGVHVGGSYGPYRQSDRKSIYRAYAEELVSKGFAYYAFDTPEELDAIRKQYESEKKVFQYDHSTRLGLSNSLSLSPEEVNKRLDQGVPYVIRFKIPEHRELILHDLIRGEIHVHSNTLDDKVLFKSDGLPTYHLANIVDDHLMEISHVIRGEEWLPSLPLHYLLYEAFGWIDTMPEFAHLPLILKPDGKGKLSKRDGDKGGFPVFPCNWKNPDGEVFLGYREWGFLPDAFINMLALLGWNPGTNQEILSKEELIRLFDMEKVNKSGARFDPEKAKWFNQQYLRKLTDDELADLLKPILKQKNIEIEQRKLLSIVSVLKERITFVDDILREGDFFFMAPSDYDPKALKKIDVSLLAKIKEKIFAVVESLPYDNEQQIEEVLHRFVEQHQLQMGDVMIPLRVALVGATRGPSLAKIIEILGKEETLLRLESFFQKV